MKAITMIILTVVSVSWADAQEPTARAGVVQAVRAEMHRMGVRGMVALGFADDAPIRGQQIADTLGLTIMNRDDAVLCSTEEGRCKLADGLDAFVHVGKVQRADGRLMVRMVTEQRDEHVGYVEYMLDRHNGRWIIASRRELLRH